MENTISFKLGEGKTKAELIAIREAIKAQMVEMGMEVADVVEVKEDVEAKAIIALFDSLLTSKVKLSYGKTEELFSFKDAMIGQSRTFDVMVGEQNRPRTLTVKCNTYRAGAIKREILKLMALFNDSPIREAVKASGPDIKEDGEEKLEIVEDETPSTQAPEVLNEAPVIVDTAPVVEDNAPEVPHTSELVETRAVKGFAKKGKGKK